METNEDVLDKNHELPTGEQVDDQNGPHPPEQPTEDHVESTASGQSEPFHIKFKSDVQGQSSEEIVHTETKRTEQENGTHDGRTRRRVSSRTEIYNKHSTQVHESPIESRKYYKYSPMFFTPESPGQSRPPVYPKEYTVEKRIPVKRSPVPRMFQSNNSLDDEQPEFIPINIYNEMKQSYETQLEQLRGQNLTEFESMSKEQLAARLTATQAELRERKMFSEDKLARYLSELKDVANRNAQLEKHVQKLQEKNLSHKLRHPSSFERYTSRSSGLLSQDMLNKLRNDYENLNNDYNLLNRKFLENKQHLKSYKDGYIKRGQEISGLQQENEQLHRRLRSSMGYASSPSLSYKIQTTDLPSRDTPKRNTSVSDQQNDDRPHSSLSDRFYSAVGKKVDTDREDGNVADAGTPNADTDEEDTTLIMNPADENELGEPPHRTRHPHRIISRLFDVSNTVNTEPQVLYTKANSLPRTIQRHVRPASVLGINYREYHMKPVPSIKRPSTSFGRNVKYNQYATLPRYTHGIELNATGNRPSSRYDILGFDDRIYHPEINVYAGDRHSRANRKRMSGSDKTRRTPTVVMRLIY